MKTFSLKPKAFLTLGLGMIGLLGFSLEAKAAVMYIESRDGELSDDHKTPTFIGSLIEGDNFLEAAIINPPPGPQDRDYFQITVPKGLQLNQIFLDSYQAGALGDDVAFIGIEQGDKITPAPPTNATEQQVAASQLLGYTLFGTRTTYDSLATNCINAGVAGQPLAPNTIVSTGQDLLPVMGIATKPPLLTNCNTAFPTTGFTSPLAGNRTYSFWIQQTAGTGETGYSLRFVAATNTIPEPSLSIGLLAVGTLGMSWKQFTQKHKN